MIRSMYTAATGMEAQQLFMDTISNNLSNVNTNGYKRSKVEFQDLMYQTLKQAGLQTPEDAQQAAAAWRAYLRVAPTDDPMLPQIRKELERLTQ